MKKQIEVPVGNKKIVAYVQDWDDGLPKEIYISLVDDEGILLQDICMVREHFSYNSKNDEFEIDDDLIDCKIWADSDNEDYTDEFIIGVYEDE
jgi:hypothetical protein